MKIAIKVLVGILACFGAASFAFWLADYPGSPFETSLVWHKYPEQYSRLEAARLAFHQKGTAAKIAELKQKLLELPISKTRLHAFPQYPNLFQIPRSVIPVGVPYRDLVDEEFHAVGTSVARLTCDASGKPQSIWIAVAREGIFIPLAPGVGPPEFTAALKLSDDPLVFALSTP